MYAQEVSAFEIRAKAGYSFDREVVVRGVLLVAVTAFLGFSSMSWAREPSRLSVCGISFSDSVNVSVGLTPCSMVVEDLDGGGHPDIVTGNCSSSDVSVLFGIGDGGFQPEQRFPLGVRPGDVAVGDLDGDGLRDLVVACVELTRLSVFWGMGGGAFSPPSSISCPPRPSQIRLVDLDSDGRLDLALLTDFVSGFSVIWGDGTRAPTGTTYPMPFHPSVFVVADFDVNGTLDLAVTACSNDSTVYVIPGMGTRQFGQPTVAMEVPGADLCPLTAGDLNGDQYPDLTAIDLGTFGGRVAVGFGAGDGTFVLTSTILAGNYPTSVAVADFDRDGAADLAVANSGSNDVSLFSGSDFQPAGVLLAGAGAGLVAAADLDGDSAQDLVVVNEGGGNVTVYLNRYAFGQASVRYSPSVYQLYSSGQPLTAAVSLPSEVSPKLDGSQVDLVWRDRVLGDATVAFLADSSLREVRFQFDRGILEALEPGIQPLSIVGCDSMGTTFRADGSLQVLPSRAQTMWQASVPGVVPVLIRVPDQAQAGLRVRIFDSAGRLVRSQVVQVGTDNLIAWDGQSNSGNRASSGVYIIEAEGGTGKIGCKLIIVR